mmetsp:Transcript_4441/g.16200  ORF Transcript_4441/g.16200 Transcript_4441/m.16200 type:complete len:212 (+) Transcript_4441:5152-5787(+)
MAFKEIFHSGICAPKKVSTNLRDAGLSLHVVHTVSNILLLEARNIPHSDCLIQRCRNDEIFSWMKLNRHHVMIMASEHYKTWSARLLPIPDTHSLIVRRADHPRIFVVELNSPDVVKMPQQVRLQASSELVIPDLDLVIITTRYKKWLRLMEIHPTHWPLVLFKAIKEGSHTIIPQLDHTVVQTRNDPWSTRMEAQTFHTITLCLKLREEF